MKLRNAVIGMISIFLIQTAELWGCTSFSFISKDHSVIAAKNYDWFFLHGHGGIYVYPRNSLRIAFTPEKESLFTWLKGNIQQNSDQQVSWRSKYGSITFTQFGKGLPIGGMNEAGLTIEMLQLNATEYPPDNGKPIVNESQWALFQLDQFATVQEVSDHLNDLSISKTFIGIHYFITDASGASAVVEFLNGAPTLYSGSNLPIPALTNDPYLELLSDRDQRGPSSVWLFRTSANRFATASKMLEPESLQNTKDDSVSYAFDVLKSVCLNGTSYDAPCEPTQWSIVYDITNKEIHYRTRANSKLKTIKMSDIDFERLDTVQVMDMNLDRSGDLTPYLQNYSSEFNSWLIEQNKWLISKRLRKAAIQHATQE